MNRIRSPRRLPALREALPGFRGLPKGTTRTFALFDAVRALARELQSNGAQPFYSTREIAAFFRISQPVVVRVYRELEAEGLLARRRSTMTLLAARQRGPRMPVRGVVGVPIWTYGHCHYSDWRLFFQRLEEHLRRHAFVADFLFFQMEDPGQSEYVDRFLAHELDSLIWLYPLPSYMQTMLQLADQGVSVAVITDRREHFPFPTYAVSWDQALRQCLTAWKRMGVSRVLTPSQPAVPSPVSGLTQRLGLETQSIQANPLQFLEMMRRTDSKGSVGAILADPAWNASAATYKEDFLSILSSHHILLLHRLELARPILGTLSADFALIDWDRLAARLANDLASGALRRQAAPVVLEAELHADAPAERFAQLF